MEVKRFLFLLFIFAVSMITARPRCSSRRGSCQCQEKSLYFSNLATPFPAYIETIDYVPNCRKLCFDCSCNDQLILPPLSVELPCGLGYFPSALPLAAKYYAPALDFLTTGAYNNSHGDAIGIASPCESLILAAPVNPEYAPLVKPIIL